MDLIWPPIEEPALDQSAPSIAPTVPDVPTPAASRRRPRRRSWIRVGAGALSAVLIAVGGGVVGARLADDGGPATTGAGPAVAALSASSPSSEIGRAHV